LTELGDFGQQEALLNIAQEILSQIEHCDPELVIRVLYNKGILMLRKGDYFLAKEIFGSVLEADIEMGTSNSYAGLKHRSDMAVCLANTGDLTQAGLFWRETYDRYVALVGSDHPEPTLILLNLGVLERLMGNFALAFEYHSQCVDVYERIFGKNHHDTSDAIACYANDLYCHGDLDRCIPLMEEVLDIERKLNRPQHVASTLNDLGNMYGDNDMLQQSIDCYLESVDIKIKLWGENHISVGLTYENIGNTYHYIKDYTAAMQYYTLSNTIFRSLYEEKHHTVGKSEYLIACCLEALQKYDEAESHFKTSIQIFEDTVETGSVLILPSLINYASFLDVVCRYQEAIDLLKRAFDIVMNSHMAEKHEHYQEIVSGLSNLHRKNGNADLYSYYRSLLDSTNGELS